MAYKEIWGGRSIKVGEVGGERPLNTPNDHMLAAGY